VSTQAIANFWPTYLLIDDFILVILVLIAVFNIDFNSSYSPKKILYALSLIIFLIFSFLYNFYSLPAFFLKSFYYAKPLFIFVFISYLSSQFITRKTIVLIYNLIVVLSCFSLIEFYFINYVDNSYVQYLSMSWRFGVFRASSLTGHPISLATMSFVGILIGTEILKKKISLITLILILALLASGTRFVIVYLPIYIFYRLLIVSSVKFNRVHYNTRKLFLASYPLIFISLFFLSTYINLKDADNLRRIALIEGAPLLLTPDNFILGTGIGSFGGAESVKYDSPIYDEINIPERWIDIMETRNKKVGPENFFFVALVEFGVVGLFLYFLVLVPPNNNRKTSYFFLFYVLVVVSFSFVYPLNILPYMYLINIVFPNGNKPNLNSVWVSKKEV